MSKKINSKLTAENYSIFYTQMIEDLEACVAGKPIRELK